MYTLFRVSVTYYLPYFPLFHTLQIGIAYFHISIIYYIYKFIINEFVSKLYVSTGNQNIMTIQIFL